MPKPISQNIIQEFINEYQSTNVSIKELAKKYNLNHVTISKYLKRNNIKVKSVSELILTPEIIQKIIDMYNLGLSEQKIEDEIHICRTTIRKVLRKTEIQIRDNSQYRAYELDENYFEKLDTNNKVYVLGFLYADGNIGKKKYDIQLSLQEGDKEILERISQDMKTNTPLVFQKMSKYNSKTGLNSQDQWSIRIHSRKMHQDLSRWGIVPQKTHIITYPDFLLDEQQSHFLRGIIDGDGCIHPYDYQYSNCKVDINGTYDFCMGAKQTIERLVGVHCSFFKTAKNKTTYRISVSGKNQVSKFLNWIYKDAELFLRRKYELYLKYYNVA